MKWFLASAAALAAMGAGEAAERKRAYHHPRRTESGLHPVSFRQGAHYGKG